MIITILTVIPQGWRVELVNIGLDQAVWTWCGDLEGGLLALGRDLIPEMRLILTPNILLPLPYWGWLLPSCRGIIIWIGVGMVIVMMEYWMDWDWRWRDCKAGSGRY